LSAPASPGRPPAGSGRPEGEPDPRRWRALSVCLIAGFMALLDVSIVNVALPSIRQGLHASESDLQWILSGYALAFGLLLVPAGRLGDVRGRRTVFVVGLALFTLASAACGVAPGAGWLSAARILQGFAGGLVIPQSAGFIQELFRGAERGKAFGLLGATIGISTAVGPLLGGLLIALGGTDFGWRLVFFVNVPVGVLAIALAFRFLPAGSTERRRESLDPVGVVLLGLGVLLLLLPLVEERQWTSPLKWLLIPAGLLVIAGFVAWERFYARRGKDPMVEIDLFRVRSYTYGTVLGLLYFAGFTAIFFVITLFLQLGLHYSALEAGLAITPFALGSAAASALGGRVVTRAGRPLVAAGLLLVAAGLAVTDLVVGIDSGRSVGWAMAAPLLVAGVGSGLVIAPNQTLTLSEVPVRRAGSAAGVLQTGQRVGSAVGIAMVGSLFFNRLAATRGDWTAAVRAALWLCIGIVVLALVLALLDIAGERHRRPTAPA
jgi:EmrB/QacA subfamily drug resistance transporter